MAWLRHCLSQFDERKTNILLVLLSHGTCDLDLPRIFCRPCRPRHQDGDFVRHLLMSIDICNCPERIMKQLYDC